jgi:hypothetical protein
MRTNTKEVICLADNLTTPRSKCCQTDGGRTCCAECCQRGVSTDELQPSGERPHEIGPPEMHTLDVTETPLLRAYTCYQCANVV